MRPGFAFTVILTLGLGACAAQPTPYQPEMDRTGYAEQQLDARTWRVQFTGNFDTPRETVENYLFYRSAEIMLSGGYEKFVLLEKVIERDVEHRGYGYSPYHFGFGFHHGHVRNFGHHRLPGYYGPRYYRSLTRYTGYATIRTFVGRQPLGDLQVYGAREVIQKLGPTVVLPEAGPR